MDTRHDRRAMCNICDRLAHPRGQRCPEEWVENEEPKAAMPCLGCELCNHDYDRLGATCATAIEVFGTRGM